MAELIFIIVLYFIIRTFAPGKGGFAPRQSAMAMIVSKRLSCTRHHHGAEIVNNHAPTSYFVTFQIEKGKRVELQVKESQYELLFEGERGKLTFRGKHFIRFKVV